jgi:thioredoxin 1
MRKEEKMSVIKEVGTDDFQSEVLQVSGPVVIDFWAEWCGPCRMLTPIVERVAEKLGDRLKVVKCNVDENPEIAARYGVKAIPNLIFFNRGQVVEQAIGVMSEAQLMAKAVEVLESDNGGISRREEGLR